VAIESNLCKLKGGKSLIGMFWIYSSDGETMLIGSDSMASTFDDTP